MERYEREDMDLDRSANRREQEIMATMRKRTMAKASTWDRTQND